MFGVYRFQAVHLFCSTLSFGLQLEMLFLQMLNLILESTMFVFQPWTPRSKHCRFWYQIWNHIKSFNMGQALVFVVLHFCWCIVAYLFSVYLQIHKDSFCSIDYDIETEQHLKSNIVSRSLLLWLDQYLVLPKY